jgi:hypothetical protein
MNFRLQSSRLRLSLKINLSFVRIQHILNLDTTLGQTAIGLKRRLQPHLHTHFSHEQERHTNSQQIRLYYARLTLKWKSPCEVSA